MDDTGNVFTIFIVGIIGIGLLLLMELTMTVPPFIEAAILIPLTALLALLILHPAKGAALGLMLRLGIFRAEDEL